MYLDIALELHMSQGVVLGSDFRLLRRGISSSLLLKLKSFVYVQLNTVTTSLIRVTGPWAPFAEYFQIQCFPFRCVFLFFKDAVFSLPFKEKFKKGSGSSWKDTTWPDAPTLYWYNNAHLVDAIQNHNLKIQSRMEVWSSWLISVLFATTCWAGFCHEKYRGT